MCVCFSLCVCNVSVSPRVTTIMNHANLSNDIDGVRGYHFLFSFSKHRKSIILSKIGELVYSQVQLQMIEDIEVLHGWTRVKKRGPSYAICC